MILLRWVQRSSIDVMIRVVDREGTGVRDGDRGGGGGGRVERGVGFDEVSGSLVRA